MCSELFRIPYSWHGVPIFGVGVLLAIWAVAATVSLVALVRRNGWNPETWSYLPVLAMIGAAIVFMPQFFPHGFPVRGYGVMLLVGISAGVALAARRASQLGIDPELILSLTIWLVVGGVIGARLFYVIEYWQEKFAHNSLRQTIVDVLNFPEGGLVIYGGFIGAVVAMFWFTRKHRLPLLALADLAAPSMMVGLAFGRLGCFLNGCCYGGEVELPWAVTFPKYASRYEDDRPLAERRYSPPYSDQAARGEMDGFRIESQNGQPAVVTQVDTGSAAAQAGLHIGDAITAINDSQIASSAQAKAIIFGNFEAGHALKFTLANGKTVEVPPVAQPARSRPVHPAQLYSAIDAALLAWVLWAFYPFRRHDGEVLALMLMLHPISRFLLEIIRIDEPSVFGTGLSISQNISFALFAGGLALWLFLRLKPAGTVWLRAA